MTFIYITYVGILFLHYESKGRFSPECPLTGKFLFTPDMRDIPVYNLSRYDYRSQTIIKTVRVNFDIFYIVRTSNFGRNRRRKNINVRKKTSDKK